MSSTNYYEDERPGAQSQESALVATDSCENFQKMGCCLKEIKSSPTTPAQEDDATEYCNNILEDFTSSCSDVSLNRAAREDDALRDEEWLGMSKSKQIFVLSSAGKPIYSR